MLSCMWVRKFGGCRLREPTCMNAYIGKGILKKTRTAVIVTLHRICIPI